MTFILQSRLPNEPAEAPLTVPPPVWVRTALAVHGLVGVGTAVALFLLPKAMIPIWPWALTPLTARALSAWFLSFGALDLFSAIEKNMRRLRVTSIGYVVSAALGLSALLRYADQADLWSFVGMCYLVYLLMMLGMGLYGWRKGK